MISQAAVYEYLLGKPTAEMILCRDDKEADTVAALVRLAGYDPYVLPDLRVSAGDDLRTYDVEVREFLVSLGRYYLRGIARDDSQALLIVPIRTATIPFPRQEHFGRREIEFGDTVDLQVLRDELYYWGYHFADVAVQPGEVSLRGDIIDIFPLDAQMPYRISLFDDEVESIHIYDPSTQKRQGDELESMSYVPAFLALDPDRYEALQSRCEQSQYESFVKDIDSLGLWHLDDLACDGLAEFHAIFGTDLGAELDEIYSLSEPIISRVSFGLPIIPTAKTWRDLEVADPNKLIEAHADKQIRIIARNESIVRGSGLIWDTSDMSRSLVFVYQEGIVNLMSSSELILSLNKPIKRRKVKKSSMILDELGVGDYVVHDTHGVGIFRGIVKREVLGATSEFVEIEYQGGDTLLIPVASLESIDRYIAEGGSVPVLDRMGKASFKKLKDKVKTKLFAIASQIINLSAQRHLKQGIVLVSGTRDIDLGTVSSIDDTPSHHPRLDLQSYSGEGGILKRVQDDSGGIILDDVGGIVQDDVSGEIEDDVFLSHSGLDPESRGVAGGILKRVQDDNGGVVQDDCGDEIQDDNDGVVQDDSGGGVQDDAYFSHSGLDPESAGRSVEIALEHRLFLSRAGFEHTEDQMRAISEMLSEMQSGRMMDRLLSADVGFGKTEVAMNGIFIAVKNGYQAMMIAPTTLLSSQHYKSLIDRFEDFGIKVGKLDRFTTPGQKRALLAGLKDGTVDVVVGTHALLGVKFKNLALVVVDEEHKFGVKQKEKLKEMAVDVHLLSMSATPIPRSLNLALSQLKSFSEILTPPAQRVGVRTFVKSYNPKLVKEAIVREVRRGGQVFYVYNSIAGIESKRDELLEILPKLRIAILHSKISAKETEEEMMRFGDGEYDLLLSTSIVESGIHMPHANTMIVDGADRFGMADLHQLRGRVGRGGREGYCYFVVEDREQLSDNARRRLLALESHSELGSGATLAFHDLQIRGGGNIIGEAQSGHIKQIGYSLYLRMLEDTIRELSGKSREAAHQVEVKLSVSAYLSEELISEDRLRLELYRRLALCETLDQVYEIESEIVDRYGKLDTMTRQFVDIIAIKVLARQSRISKVSSYGQKIFIEYIDPDTPRRTLESPSKDDDDIILTILQELRKKS